MEQDWPQLHANNLVPARVDKVSLQAALTDLHDAIEQGIALIAEKCQPPPNDTVDGDFGNISTGLLGIATLHIYQFHQAGKAIEQSSDSRTDYTLLARFALPQGPAARQYIPRELPSSVILEHGRTSPLCNSGLGAAFLQIAALSFEAAKFENPEDTLPRSSVAEQAAHLIRNAVDYALEQPPAVTLRGHKMGIDEVLNGRAGLLWALMLLDRFAGPAQDERALIPDGACASLFDAVPDLIEAIISAGSQGHSDPKDAHSKVLTWPWIDQFHSCGAMHGDTGILAALLQAPYNAIEKHAEIISSTITSLCRVCMTHNGHLPMSIPAFPSKTTRANPLVQICHGTPGLLLLLACAKRNEAFRHAYWKGEWDQAFDLGSEVVWEQGLLGKGGGLCHGIAGNALPWLLWSEVAVGADEHNSRNDFLGKAIAFLKECKMTPPFFGGQDGKYRTPDHPYSLFEGLAGTVIVWLKGAKVIGDRLELL